MPFPFHAVRCALPLLAFMLATGTALAQGVTPYDTFRMPVAAPPIPATSPPCRTTATCSVPVWPLLTMSDPFMERVRPARGYGEIGDAAASYFEWQADLTRQKANRCRPWMNSGACGCPTIWNR